MDKGEAQVSDYGVFASSKCSVQHNLQVSTSMFLETDESVRQKIVGNPRR
jgi:hypothetical protein